MTDAADLPLAHTRGIQRIWDPRVWGTMVGAVGATVFVMTNRGKLADPWPLVALAIWVLALLAYVAFVFVVPRAFGHMSQVGARQALTTVVAVGLHFLPFAGAFHTRMFIPLGTTMAVLGLAGVILGWIMDARSAAAIAVITGIIMLIFMATDAGHAARIPRV
ncbi:MAG: hypothetical protein H7226_09110 [Salinibacterium sp.]|nr:hypothetical protein [Salinibacterium sp.]